MTPQTDVALAPTGARWASAARRAGSSTRATSRDVRRRARVGTRRTASPSTCSAAAATSSSPTRGSTDWSCKIDIRGVERVGATDRAHLRRRRGRAVGPVRGARRSTTSCAGLECLSGIPGLVGGTPVQNVGAYGQDVSGTHHARRVRSIAHATRRCDGRTRSAALAIAPAASSARTRPLHRDARRVRARAGRRADDHLCRCRERISPSTAIGRRRWPTCATRSSTIRRRKGMVIEDGQSGESQLSDRSSSIRSCRATHFARIAATVGADATFRTTRRTTTRSKSRPPG